MLVIVLLVTFACKTNMKTSKSETILSTLIAKGNLYGSGAEGIKAQNIVVSNQNDWDTLITKMNSVNTVTSGFSEVEIDFSVFDVVAVFGEVKGSGGFSLDLNMTKNSENIVVAIKQNAPDRLSNSVMTQPFYIVKVRKSDLPIIFTKTNE
tara:strand:- start:46309 stop:46761 length:453 start_codon:yes stop_codon:yes gene_type:complete